MTRVSELAFAAIDFESAGVASGQTDVPVQVGVAIMEAGAISDPFGSYIKSDRPIVWSARQVHGITDADVATAPTLPALWPALRSRLAGRWAVAHGAGTERRFLRAFPAHGFGPWIDTLVLARAALPDLESHALSAIVTAINEEDTCHALVPGFRWHDALSDAVASLVFLRWLIDRAGLANEPSDILLNPDRSRYRARRSNPPR